jgi:hypothetical protein
MSDKRVSDRGFRIYDQWDGSQQYGAACDLRVYESSIAGRGPAVWLSSCSGGVGITLHLLLNDAKRLHAALGAFIAEAEAGELTEKPA